MGLSYTTGIGTTAQPERNALLASAMIINFFMSFLVSL